MGNHQEKCQNDRAFRSQVYQAGVENGIPRSTMNHRLNTGADPSKITQRHMNREATQIDGVWYESISEAVRQTGIRETKIRRYRGDDGVYRYTPQVQPSIEVTFLGQKYPDICAAAKVIGASETSFRRWRKSGLSDEEIVAKLAKPTRRKRR